MKSNNNERTVFDLKLHGVKRGVSFGHYNYKAVKPALESHWHKNTLEICYCMKGQQHYIANKQSFVLNGNDLFIVPPNTPHSTGEYPEDKGELFWIQVLIEKSHGKLCYLPENQSRMLLERLLTKSLLVFSGAFRVKPILEKLMLQFQNQDSSFKEIQINQLIVQLLLETLMLSQQVQSSTILEKLRKLDIYIHNNLHRIIYVDELAMLVNMSTGYFKSWFKLKSGMPPKEYVNRARIEQAKVWLPKYGSVTKVAFDLGFSSSQYFATTFKKYTGYTPKAFIQFKIKAN